MTALTLFEPQALLNRDALTRSIEARLAAGGDAKDRRLALLPALKQALDVGRAEIQRRFMEESNSGLNSIAETAYLTDQIVRTVLDYATTWAYPRSSRTAGESLSVLAVGGYGREEMAPYSDIDLLFLLPYRATPLHEQVVEFVLYTLWDLKLKVGQATRSIEECIRLARSDVTVCTALLESRFIWGDENLAQKLETRFHDEVVAGKGADFIEAKLTERDERHLRMGDTRYFLEPNIKDGKGGLRDLQTLFWIARFIYGVSDEAGYEKMGVLTHKAAKRFRDSRRFLFTVRCHLHYLAGRAEERLTFDLQPEIARRMHFVDRNDQLAVERFMQRYFLTAKTVGDLTRIFCAVLEEQQKRRPRLSLKRLLPRKRAPDGFNVDSARLAVSAPDAFVRDPQALLRLFKVAHEQELDIHPNTLRLVNDSLGQLKPLRNDPEANALFMSVLASRRNPEPTLRQMSEAGVLGRFLPEFGKVTAQMQFDMYHVYTTDEHTVRAIGLLHRVESGELKDVMPLAIREFRNVISRRALYVAVFLHDIAKGQGGDHSEEGAKIALRLGPRLGLTDEETDTVAWLVRQHLLMSRIAFSRDLENPKTVEDFCKEVQSMERLRLLMILTTVDILAVGPSVWNNWKASLLRELFVKAENVLKGGDQEYARQERIEDRRARLAQALTDWPERDRQKYVESHYPLYWLTFDSLNHIRHARIIEGARKRDEVVTVEVIPDSVRGVSEVVVYTRDQPGLFSKIAGGLAVGGVTIVEAKITTMVDGMALDVFTVQTLEGEVLQGADRIKRLADAVQAVLEDRLDPAQALAKMASRLPERTRAMKAPSRVLIDNQASKTHTVVEVNGRDRPGLLYALTQAFAAIGVHIFSARVNTYGAQVVDVFYVKDCFGMKVEHKMKLAEIRSTLTAVLADQPGREQGEPGSRAATSG